MRILPLPVQHDALRPILDDLNRYIGHFDSIDVETDLAAGDLEVSKDVLIANLDGSPEAKSRLEDAYEQHLIARPWLKPRLQ